MLFISFSKDRGSEEANEKNNTDQVASGISIESASYMENSIDSKAEDTISDEKKAIHENLDEEYTPKLFTEEKSQENFERDSDEEAREETLFEQDNLEDEDFEIPAFLRRQKF